MAVQIKTEQIKNLAIDSTKLDGSSNYSFSGQLRYTGSDSNTQGIATRGYVDSVAAGLDPKASCKVATTANITLSGTQTIDGFAVSAGDRVLCKDQSTASQNGVYICDAGSWSRSSDMAVGSDAAGNSMFIEQGTVNGDLGFVCVSDKGSAVVGTNNLSFSIFAGQSNTEAGAGLSKTGNRIDVEVDDSSIQIVGDALQVKALGITSAMLAGSVANAKLANSTISGKALGSNLDALSASASGGITMSSYTGASAVADIALKLTGTTLNVSAAGLKVSDGGIAVQQIADNAVSNAKLAGSITADKLTLGTSLANASGSLVLANGVAGNGIELSAGQVLSLTLDGTSLALGASGVKINDNGVVSGMLADNAVATAAVADNAITNVKLAGSITADKLAGSIPADKLKLGNGLQDDGGDLRVKTNGDTIDRSGSGIKVADGQIGATQLTDASITGAKLSFAPKYVSLAGEDGSKTAFDLPEALDATLVTGSIVYLNGLALQKVASSPGADQYTVSATGGTGGVGQIVMGSAPDGSDDLTCLYFG